MKQFLKRFIPEAILKSLRPSYHGSVAVIASSYFGHPSEKLVVIGVTGTGGKSTTVNILAHILNSNQIRTGFVTTTNYSYGGDIYINKHGLSMPSPWMLQKQMKEMVKEGCRYAVIECTSEGLAQNRHLGISFDGALFTNLSPAHIDSHGSFENYKHAKGKLFEALEKSPKKRKIIGVNLDDAEWKYFSSFKATEKFGVTAHSPKEGLGEMNVFTVGEVEQTTTNKFKIQDTYFTLKLPGMFNAYNAMMAIATANSFGLSLENASSALENFKGVPGRMESIANNKGFEIIVDYACEPTPLKEALKTAKGLTSGRLIHVFGSTGGHRDVEKRFLFGRLSAQYADVCIVTNDDVYNSDPEKIAQDILTGIHEINSAKNTYKILDRKEAISKALEIAKEGDLVFFTGKGSEQFLVKPGNTRIAWDEREEIRKLL